MRGSRPEWVDGDDMRVVVTGATSFIGAATVRHLLEQGETVYAVVRPGSQNLQHLKESVPEGADDRLQVVELDLHQIEELPNRINSQNKEKFSDQKLVQASDLPLDQNDSQNKVKISEQKLVQASDLPLDQNDSQNEEILSDQNHDKIGKLHLMEDDLADAWIHIGWDGAGSENRTKRDVQQGNVVQSLAAVRTAAALGCRRFIFTGSQAEYGVCHDWIREDTPLHPVSEYGKAKVDFYTEAKSLCKSLKMEYIHTRIFSIYGPGDHPWSLVNTCLQTWRHGDDMQFGPCTQQWNFLYIEDIVDALYHLLTEGESGCYNLAGEDTRPLRAYIEEIYELCGRRGTFTYGIRPQNAEGPADLMPDISKILKSTTWRPKVKFEDGIRTMLSLEK
jgi:nucleoside-diphosphate-sugar epimerase